MRDAGHRTPDAGHRTSAKKAKIIYPPPRGVDIIKSGEFVLFSIEYIQRNLCFSSSHASPIVNFLNGYIIMNHMYYILLLYLSDPALAW